MHGARGFALRCLAARPFRAIGTCASNAHFGGDGELERQRVGWTQGCSWPRHPQGISALASADLFLVLGTVSSVLSRRYDAVSPQVVKLPRGFDTFLLSLRLPTNTAAEASSAS
ncbi:hypothetical protein PHYSODRAFT_294806 [Phytophthora sojae]|uniref:Uncharacterized protein n=1 Tax=Phytophthora sojae (strain P6497) TaxID=1094619 RepID=G4YN24_PHYSP|nr:hypothetical protein PHYSODRAFT_294806 [Phytophthora sojae]EGZ29819.1 hypothetical protein PHYSODRAFT_294806 [Phytophthora sojae]|eukprot:XP_009517094.1 hypothetical protein PHYSODRAFT_294806 [Phytophthora sojae]